MHVNGEAVRLRGDHSLGHHDFADAVVLGDVSTEYRTDAFECAGSDHGARAAAALLCRLEYEPHVHVRRRIGQQSSRTQYHGHMRIMSARVHFAFDARREGKIGVFGTREGVHVRTQRDGAAVTRRTQIRDHTGTLAAIRTG